MGIVVVPSFGADPVSVTGPGLDAKVDGLATEFNGSIDNDNIKTAANIANSKLNLASISQNIAHSGTMSHTGAVTLGAATTMSAKDFTEAKGADVASASTTTIWVTDGNFIHITGTTTITSFGTAGQAGDERTIVFDGALTLTHNATSLILPTGADITTAAGDTAIVRAETTANARVISYNRKSGVPLVASAPPTYTTTTDSTTSDETTTSASYADTTLSITFSPGKAGLAVYSFNGTDSQVSASGLVSYAIVEDGTVVQEVACQKGSGNDFYPISMSHATQLTAASHTVKIQFKTSGGTATLAGASRTARLTVSYLS